MVNVIHPGSGFGELGILTECCRRQATVKCRNYCVFATLSKANYAYFLQKN